MQCIDVFNNLYKHSIKRIYLHTTQSLCCSVVNTGIILMFLLLVAVTFPKKIVVLNFHQTKNKQKHNSVIAMLLLFLIININLLYTHYVTNKGRTSTFTTNIHSLYVIARTPL